MPKLNETRLGEEIGKKPPKARYIWAACPRCGHTRWTTYLVRKEGPRNPLCRRCAHSGTELTSCGFRDKDGYNLIRLPRFHPERHLARKNGDILEHRLVMARLLGRKLKPTEHVHHLNGIKKDNRPENLILMNRDEHLDRHRGKPYVQRIQDLERTVKCLEARLKILESETVSPQPDFYSEPAEAL